MDHTARPVVASPRTLRRAVLAVAGMLCLPALDNLILK